MTALEELVGRWRAESDTTPIASHTVLAVSALRRCADELEDALAEAKAIAAVKTTSTCVRCDGSGKMYFYDSDPDTCTRCHGTGRTEG